VAEKTNFLNAFTRVLDRYIKQEVDSRLLLACIVAMGTNMGLWKMAEVSGLSYSSLLTTARNFLRAETLHASNDGIANATAALSMFDPEALQQRRSAHRIPDPHHQCPVWQQILRTEERR
jgi:hypothetical protein